MNKIYFYTPQDEPYGCFSNFSPYGVKIDGFWWVTVEHYFQANKFINTPLYDIIRKAKNPKQAKKLGWTRDVPLRKDWETVKVDIMRTAVFCKFKTHQKICEILLSTNDQEIVENAPHDYFWGCGKDGSGKNMLGKLLMEVRSALTKFEQKETS